MGMSVNSASRAAAEKTVRQLRDPRAREDITRLGMSLNSRSRAVAEETARKAMLERLRKQEQELQNERDFLWGFEQDMTGGQLYYTPSSKHRTSAQAGTELAEVRRQIAELETWTQAEKYAGIKNAEDFALTAAWTRAQPPATAIPVWQGDLKVRNIVRAIQAAEQSGASSLSSVSQVDQKWDHMTEEEQDVLLYYVGNGQLEEAGAYLDWLEESVNQREGVRIGQAVRGIDNGLGRTVATGGYGVIAGIDQFAGGVAQAFSDDRRPTSATQYASRYIREDLADSGPQFAGSSIGQTLYDVGTGLGYMAPSILVSALTAGAGAPAAAAGAAGSAAMGLSSYGGAYTQALDEGYSKEQARTYGALVGAGEAVLQYLLGGIGKLGGAAGNKLLSKVAAFDSGLKRASATMGVRLGSEIGEEELQNHVIEPLLRTLIFGEDFDLPTIEELTQTALVTALTTGVLETGEIAQAGRENVPAVEIAQDEGYNAYNGGRGGYKGKNTPTTLEYKATSGVKLISIPGKTTTILGRYDLDTKDIIGELNLPKSTDFSGNPGGFNLLNTPDELYVELGADGFWEQYNRPFLDAAIDRGDEILMATPINNHTLYTKSGKLTGYGREYYYLQSKGYQYVDGKMIPNGGNE